MSGLKDSTQVQRHHMWQDLWLKVGLHCFKELQFIGESETMQTNIVCWSAMAADKECVVVTTTTKSLIGQLAPGQHACLLLNKAWENILIGWLWYRQCSRRNWSTIGQTILLNILGKWRLSRTGKNFFLGGILWLLPGQASRGQFKGMDPMSGTSTQVYWSNLDLGWPLVLCPEPWSHLRIVKYHLCHPTSYVATAE